MPIFRQQRRDGCPKQQRRSIVKLSPKQQLAAHRCCHPLPHTNFASMSPSRAEREAWLRCSETRIFKMDSMES